MTNMSMQKVNKNNIVLWDICEWKKAAETGSVACWEVGIDVNCDIIINEYVFAINACVRSMHV